VKVLTIPMAHFDQVEGMISGGLLDRIEATDRIHTESGLDFGAAGAALVHW